MIRTVIIAAAAACGLASSALAHEFWIQPTKFHARRGEPIGVGLMVGDGLPGEPVARNPERIVRFDAVRLEPDGSGPTPASSTPIVGRPGDTPAGAVGLRDDGPAILVFRSNHSRVELEAAKFEDYLREDGMEKIIDRRRARGQSNQPGREAYSRCAKALVSIGDAAPTAAPRDQRVGLRHELLLLSVTDADPATPGVTLHLRDLFDNAPLEGAQVCVRSARHEGEKVCGRTDAAGEVRIDVPWTGMLLVSAVHMVEAPAELKADWESTWTSLTFELPAATRNAGTTAPAAGKPNDSSCAAADQ